MPDMPGEASYDFPETKMSYAELAKELRDEAKTYAEIGAFDLVKLLNASADATPTVPARQTPK